MGLTHFEAAPTMCATMAISRAGGHSSGSAPGARTSACGGSKSRQATGRRPSMSTAVRRRSSTCWPGGASRCRAPQRRRSEPATASSTAPTPAPTPCTRPSHSTCSHSARACTTRAPAFPRLGMSIVGSRAVDSVDGTIDGEPIQFVREGKLGAPALPEHPGPRPASIVNVDDVERIRRTQTRVDRTRRLREPRSGVGRHRPSACRRGARRRSRPLSTATRSRRRSS